jgi:hypothetical protein
MFAHEAAGAARIRRSLRPLISEGGSEQQNSGELGRENAKPCRCVRKRYTLSLVIARLDRATQYSRDAGEYSRGCGVLGRPVKPDDDSCVGSDEAIQLSCDSMDCFAELVIGRP